MADGPKIRVLLVDDSQAYRLLLRRELEEDPAIEVVSQAVNGRLALPRIRHFLPDFVVLDQEMPEMDGLDTLRHIRDNWPQIGVIMFSSHTVEGARITLKALELGALDFVPKPSGGDPALYIRTELVGKIKALALTRQQESRPVPMGRPRPRLQLPGLEVCAIGISTGGPVALRLLLSQLPQAFPVPVLVVQHMPPVFTRQLADSLSEQCLVSVIEGADGMPVEKGKVYLAPGGRHMVAKRKDGSVVIGIEDSPPELNCKPSVNVLFRSVAQVYGSKVLVLIMTGMGEDGYEGIKTLKAQGAQVLAQSLESCVVFGMPARPVREGLVDAVLDIDGLAEAMRLRSGLTEK